MSWDDEAATWDDHPAVQIYARAALGSLEQACASRAVTIAGARVLDFGCGTGLLTVALAEAGAEVVGLDVSAAMLAVLEGKKVAGVTTVQGPLDAASGAPALAAPFDLITCSSVCAFLQDYPGTVVELVALLRPGGLFVQWDWEWDATAEEPMGLTRAAVQAALEGAGLTEVEVDTGFEAAFEGMVMRPVRGIGRRP